MKKKLQIRLQKYLSEGEDSHGAMVDYYRNVSFPKTGKDDFDLKALPIHYNDIKSAKLHSFFTIVR